MHYLKAMCLVVLTGVLFPSMAATTDPHAMANQSPVTLEGTVDSVSRSSFVLNYGHGKIAVEMDGRGQRASGFLLKTGDVVSVKGRIDKDKGEGVSIEASSVYVKNLGTWFYASAADEEDSRPHSYASLVFGKPHSNHLVSVRGEVKKVYRNWFLMQSGKRSIRVNTKNMPYNPLDKHGRHRVTPGDVIRVEGYIRTLSPTREQLQATAIETLVIERRLGTAF
jgi:uncharacterized protein YdeI (BOF family)